MTRKHRWVGAVALAFGLATSPAEAQFFEGGFWGDAFGASTPQGDMARGAGIYAMGMGRFNLETAKAEAIDAETTKRWNEYIWNSRLESARIYRQKLARQDERFRTNSEAIRLRLRNTPNQVDITSGNALNVALDELNDPRLFPKAVYYGAKVKVGGDTIRDIPFQYAAAAISISVQQLVQGDPPACLRRDEFTADLATLRAIVTELRQQSEELGEDKPETIKKAKDQVLAIRAKVEATFPRNSQDFRDANRYLKALYGLASMLETPAVNVLLAGVEKRPEATLGDLMEFMSDYNLRFGASTTNRQRQVYLTLFPLLSKLREEVVPAPDAATSTTTATVADAPGAVFDGLGFNHAEKKTPSQPAPK